MREQSHNRRGFTLTEIAIVFGIVGMILGAIWVAGGTVSDNRKISLAATELMDISSGIRSLYSTNPKFPSGTQTDITCSLINLKVFPQDTLRETCVQGNAATYPANPWGGPIVVYSSTSAPDASATQFEIQMSPIPSYAVQSLVALMAGSAASAGITYLFDGGSKGWIATTPTITMPNIPSTSDTNFSSDWTLRG